VASHRLPEGSHSGDSEVFADRSGQGEDWEASQRASLLGELRGLLRDLGFKPGEVIAGLDVEIDSLHPLEYRIPFAAIGHRLKECAVKTGCPHFGLLLGQRARLSHLGLPGQMAFYAPTLRGAIRNFAAYQHLNSEGMVTFLMEKDRVATLGVVVYQKSVEHVEQIYDLAVATMLSLIREVCGARWRPDEVCFSREKPSDVSPYRGFFQAPCRFNSDRTAIVFPARMLDHRLPTANAEKLRILEIQARSRHDPSVVACVRRTLRVLLLGEGVSADQVARDLAMHRRTLNRRLKAEGTTFKALLDEARFEAARQLLDSTHLLITEIGASLGYAETSAFGRAFRRWSGMTPIQSRQKTQARPS
jgi:AraC-like DNA-binding protein